ncbi:helix-turn-helix domain-containing protein [Carnobacterium maltaromaticum]|uniref:helix-turn-helix domain-containing protein n=1 Tax=Carnobacterium maltaromaticum TaxID=2751 RepID=UPI00165C3CF3|nr:helix-turn-helix transcriptional regulator [Carnobacterium maltaromaticum]MBC9788585.1 helix-turn-helix domain-containing protein [Carnobacterium maltaromaticum]
MTFGMRLKQLRTENKMTQTELGEKLNVTKASISGYENGTRNPDQESLVKIAEIFNVSTDYLLGKDENKKKYYELTDKDEKDISERLQVMIEDLENNAHYSKENGEMDDNTRELLIMSLENSLRIAKQEAKKKFTPKKYRN